MRIYYIFNIKKEVYDIYKNTPSVIYNFLLQLYSSKRDSLDYGNTIFKQVANKFNKEILDLKIYLKLHNKLFYSKKCDEHIINDIFFNEISIMKIKKSYIVINTNKKYTELFYIISLFYKDCLVCDFVNQNYFFLERTKMLV